MSWVALLDREPGRSVGKLGGRLGVQRERSSRTMWSLILPRRRVRDATRRAVPAIAALFVLTSPPATARPRVPLPCAEGRFDVVSGSIMDRTVSDDAIVIQAGHVTVASGCGTTSFSLRRTKAGPVLRARWKHCLAGGAVRLRASFTSDCGGLQGRVLQPKRRLVFQARRERAAQKPPDSSSTFGVISQQIFVHRGCTVAACHGESRSAGLDLRPGAAYEYLVNVRATGAPGSLRVAPGHASDSFLSRKVRGQLAPTEGARMPLVGDPLPVLERDLIDVWIDAGAPETGTVSGASTLDPLGYQPAAAPPVPPGGIQLVLDGLTSLDTTFGINVPPFTQLIRRGRYVNTRGAPMNMLHVSGHMHKRGLRFSAWQSDGTKLFDDYDWSHPTGRDFDPLWVLAAGVQGGNGEVFAAGTPRRRRPLAEGLRRRVALSEPPAVRLPARGEDHVELQPQLLRHRRPRRSQFRRGYRLDRRPRSHDRRAALPARPFPSAVVDRAALRRPETGEDAERRRLRAPAGALPDPRAVRREGGRLRQQPLSRFRQAGRRMAVPARAAPHPPSLDGATLRRPLRTGHGRRQLRRLRRPDRV